MLASLRELSLDAQAGHFGLGAFNVIHLEHATAFVRAAERAQCPVVLQISENAVKYHGDLEPIALAALAIARKSAVPVVVHLDHVKQRALIEEAARLGFPSVMFDGSTMPDDENREATAEVVAYCHAHGVDVEAELGEVGGKNGVHDPTARTSPDAAAAFLRDTAVDLLAVAVGSSHAMTTQSARLDNDLIRAIRAAVDVPLVLHGSSGVSDDDIVAAIAVGITKVNVATHFNQILTETVRCELASDPTLVDSRKWFAPAREAVEDEAFRLLTLYRRAAEPASWASSWRQQADPNTHNHQS